MENLRTVVKGFSLSEEGSKLHIRLLCAPPVTVLLEEDYASLFHFRKVPKRPK